MARSKLRVYFGPEDSVEAEKTEPKVTVPLAEIFPLLSDALRSQRAWLRDFQDDEITISSDLYEVLLAYQHFRPSA